MPKSIIGTMKFIIEIAIAKRGGKKRGKKKENKIEYIGYNFPYAF